MLADILRFNNSRIYDEDLANINRRIHSEDLANKL